MPGRGKPPRLQSVPELWEGIIGQPLFGGMLLGVTLAGAVASGRSPPVWMVVLVGGLLGVWATAVPVVHTRELVRRRAWVPPGTARHPILMALTLSVLLMAAGVALGFVGIGIGLLVEPVSSPALKGALICGLGFAVIGLVYLVRRLSRRA